MESREIGWRLAENVKDGLVTGHNLDKIVRTATLGSSLLSISQCHYTPYLIVLRSHP